MTARLVPIILCGGAGARLWPLSRPERPKTLVPFADGPSTFTETLDRVADPTRFEPGFVLCAEAASAEVARQMSAAGAPHRLVVEPEARDTAAAVAAAGEIVRRDRGDAVMAVMPSDHLIEDGPAFRVALASAGEAGRAGHIATLGIEPASAHDGYGYIVPGRPLGDGVFACESFREKPGKAEARRLIAGGALWNGGMFVMRADVALAELQSHAPDVLYAARRAVAEGAESDTVIHLGSQAFGEARRVSFDRAVMERTLRAAVVPAAFGWSDIGDWAAMHALCDADEDGNVVVGAAHLENTRNAYVRSDGLPVAVIGLDDVAVVVTEHGVLVGRRDCAEATRRIAGRLAGRRG